jgi:hypothetical protein
MSATIPPPEVIYVDAHKVACNGGGGALEPAEPWSSMAKTGSW